MRSPTRIAETGPVRHIGKGTAMTLVVIENVGSVVGHVQIGATVVIYVADRNSHTVPCIASLRRLCNIREGTVALVAVVGIGAGRAVIAWQGRAVDDVQVEEAVPSASKNAAPEPMASGMYFRPLAPFTIAESQCPQRGSPRQSGELTGR